MSEDEDKAVPAERDKSSVEFFNELMPFIDEGAVIPIISNSFRIEEIFWHDKDLVVRKNDQIPEFYDEELTVEEQLTKEWAGSIEYPMPDDHNLARVAQYRQVLLEDSELAKKEYLKFLSDRFLRMIQNDVDAEELKDARARKKLLFSDLVRTFDYPRFATSKDPLRLLAKLDLPIYVTTSYHTFLEQALAAEDKEPCTQVCFLNSNTLSVNPSHLPDPDYSPTPKKPVVYHLFGLENYARTVVVSEDDYMNFLMSAVDSINEPDLFPSSLRLGLSESRLLLLGYHLRDWDFRSLFRFILACRKNPGVPPSIVIQLMPNLKIKEFETKSLKFLEQYFKEYKFRVKWTRTERFIYDLWDTWNEYKG